MQEIKVLGIPINYCSGPRTIGAHRSPELFRQHGLLEVLSRKYKVKDLGDVVLPPCKRPDYTFSKMENFPEFQKTAEQAIATLVRHQSHQVKTICLGGDHAMAFTSIRAALNTYPDLGVIWIDQHPDIQTDATTISGYIHGFPLAGAMGLGNEDLIKIGGLKNNLKPENTLILGLVDTEVDEAELIRMHSLKIEHYYRKPAVSNFLEQMLEAINQLSKKTKHIWLSFDLDSLNSSFMPGVGMPNPFGFKQEEIEEIADYIALNINLVGMDVVEYDYRNDKNSESIKAAINLVCRFLGVRFSHFD